MKYANNTRLKVNKNYNHTYGYKDCEYIHVAKGVTYPNAYDIKWNGKWHNDGWDVSYIENLEAFTPILNWKERLVK